MTGAVFERLNDLDSFKVLTKRASERKSAMAVGVADSQKCHLIAALCRFLSRGSLIITHSDVRAKEISEDMRLFLGDDRVAAYPVKDVLFYNADVHSVDIVKRRLQTLDRLMNGENVTIALSVEALFDRLAPKRAFKQAALTIKTGDEITMRDISEKLSLNGYERSGAVEGPGQFAVRGGILDVFPSTMDRAARIEYWGDEVDSIRVLDAYAQRSVENIEELSVLPMSEFVFGEKELDRAIGAINAEAKELFAKYEQNGLDADGLRNYVSESLETLQKCADRFGMYFYDDNASLFDYLPKDTLVFFDDPALVEKRAETAAEEFRRSMESRVENGRLLPRQADMVYSFSQITSFAQGFPLIALSTLGQGFKHMDITERAHFNVKSLSTPRNRFDLMLEDLKGYVKANYSALFLSGSRTRGQRLADEMAKANIPARFYEDDAVLTDGAVTVTHGALHKGFEYKDLKLAIMTDAEIFGEEKKKKRRAKNKNAIKIENFTDIKPGDYIVHDNHGIGVYKGIETIVADGVGKDYIKLQYADGGNLYVHTSQLDMVQKYIGGDGARLKLNKLGGSEWLKAKSRTRKAVEIFAKDLVGLYARRQASKGFAFGADNVWQKEFEEMFPFEETDDQITAIEDVKSDMESVKVMDRLICGDVGYGKTEVAIRAAFKAAQDGKQVAYLAPTTILAQQHYNTFAQRMKDFPIYIELLSRFRTKKQQLETLERLEKGQADIVIGTHRLLSKDVKFKNLGLVVIDEEQRFGVGHKEKLKSLKENVDALTLTATPIPRTLHMSLTGIRDMSVLEEPPQERRPVQTYVMERSPEFTRDAILREIGRGGQVYYLHNRVRNISEEAARVRKLAPEATVAYAHGQMSESDLEDIMIDFINGNTQVLVCTTIIESGLDIPNVNTIIIQDADRLGLAQLYQLRGRVGRSNRQAYAYLMYRRDRVLREDAEKRLQTIRDFTEFGSGFRIAMRDMEIRGAGNLLGGEQHGHMDAVGYDMYCKILSEVIGEMREERPEETFETSIDININACIPSYYIDNEEQKLDVYKKISLIKNEDEYFDAQEEIEDRFGPITPGVQNLLDIALLKAYAHNIDVSSVTHKRGSVIMAFRPDAGINPENALRVVLENPEKLTFSVNVNPVLAYRCDETKGIDLWEIKELLKQMA
ncbi:MAG: transcription-repair coupling factor [Clostridiales bacterium]|jgi:transcription-repair coupling factor (superfamily II helicase)|nr:transcription-repair coupling factor [Clostridiales bacterium]